MATFLSTDRQAYDTHLNYIKCLASLMNGASLQYSGGLKKASLPNLDQKKNLISLTKKSLNDERRIVGIDQDYSYASTSWLPVKSYCLSKELQFSEPLLNQVFDHSILSHTVASGANLSGRTSTADMYKMAIRKIAKYKLEDWKQKNKIDLRKPSHKIRREQYLQSFTVSIFDFSYYMRIRSNYRDFAFIDGVTTADTAEYFKTFFDFTAHFVAVLEKSKRSLVSARI